MSKKLILHLCADVGSDSWYYQKDPDYNVILVGKDIGVENFSTAEPVYGIIANPVCTDFSNARPNATHDIDKGMFLVNHCLRIIKECNPTFWVLENPAGGELRKVLGKPVMTYQPWWYGSPWTKHTALWGKFNVPKRLYTNWNDVPNKLDLYIRPGSDKPSLAPLGRWDVLRIPEFRKFADKIHTNRDLRSLCCDGFAREFYNANK